MSLTKSRLASLAALLTAAGAPSALAKEPTPGLSGGGSVPLTEVLELAKPYPNLVLQVRLQLVRANLKREQVICTGRRFGTQWTQLGGARLGPYECAIGKQRLLVETAQTYTDVNGHKLKVGDKDLLLRAANVKEASFKWNWK